MEGQPNFEREERDQQAVEREEERLQLLEQVREFEKNFGHWSMGEYAKQGGRMRAASAALGIIEAILQDDEQKMKGKLDRAAFELGYRLQEGQFEDSASPERLKEIERNLEESRREAWKPEDK
jgi:hypothetical protein